MKKLDLNALGVEEMSVKDALRFDGGVGPGSDISGSTYEEDQAILSGMGSAASAAWNVVSNALTAWGLWSVVKAAMV